METLKDKISIVGMGPGSESFVTSKAWNAIRNADVVAGSDRLLQLVDDNKIKVKLPARAQQAIGILKPIVAGKKVAVLVSGDPLTFSLGNSVIKEFGKSNCEIIPGLSSVQIAFAKLGQSAINAKIISMHGRETQLDLSELTKFDKIAILSAGQKTVAKLRQAFESLADEFDAFVCENLTLANEQIYKIDITKIDEINIASLAIIIFIKKELA